MKNFSCQKYRQQILEMFSLNIDIQRSSGIYHYDSQGRVILDGISQYGACPFGHNPKDIVAELVDYYQSESPNFVQPFIPKSTKELAKKLLSLAGENYYSVVFGNSGTETVEAAIKLSRIRTGRRKILSATNSYHGKTFASLSATGSLHYSSKGIVDDENYMKVEFNNLVALEAEIETGKYAALILEPIQGEGGMNPAEENYLHKASVLCSKYGTLFILDEIQTGLGRSGDILASKIYDVEADIILLSKALGGGLIPIGAMIISQRAYSLEFDKKHSSTFANGGAASAVANAVLKKLMADNGFLIKHIQTCETHIISKLRNLAKHYPDVFAFSGKGMMYAIKFKDNVTKGNYLVNYAHKSDLLSLVICGYLFHNKRLFCMPLLRESDNAEVRFQPALNITLRELNLFLDGFKTVCQLISNQRYDILMSHLVSEKIQEGAQKLKSKKKWKDILSPPPVEKPDSTFGFLMHSTSKNDIICSLPEKIKQNYTDLAQQELASWLFSFGEVDYTPKTVFQFSMKSKAGSTVNGSMIYSPIGPESIMRLNRFEKDQLMDSYIMLAKKNGANIVGLGAYTSVITNGGMTLKDEIPITTGNSLTAISTCKSIEALFDGNATHSSLMLIGARGSVGRIALIYMSNFFGRIVLLGSPYTPEIEQYKNLRSVLLELQKNLTPILKKSAAGRFFAAAKEIGKKEFLTTENEHILVSEINTIFTYLKDNNQEAFTFLKQLKEKTYDIDCVFSATSEGKAFISPGNFRSGCHIFDVARPFDVLNTSYNKNIHEGGLVSMPDKDAYLSDCNIISCRPGVNLACLSETIALSMENVDQSYSIGREIPLSQAKDVFRIAKKHGFDYFFKPPRKSPNQTGKSIFNKT